MEKQAQVDTLWDEFKSSIDYLEYKNTLSSEVECDLMQTHTLSKEDAWDLYDYREPCQIRADEEDETANNLDQYLWEQELQWHHIAPVNIPYWKGCVNTIEENLK